VDVAAAAQALRRFLLASGLHAHLHLVSAGSSAAHCRNETAHGSSLRSEHCAAATQQDCRSCWAASAEGRAAFTRQPEQELLQEAVMSDGRVLRISLS
jgi:hypothetical protein